MSRGKLKKILWTIEKRATAARQIVGDPVLKPRCLALIESLLGEMGSLRDLFRVKETGNPKKGLFCLRKKRNHG